MVFPKEIETERLLLKKPNFEDEIMREIYENTSGKEGEKITELTPWSPNSNIREVEEKIESWIEDWNNRESAHYILINKKNDEFVGLGGINIDWNKSKGEMGCWIKRDSWGKGYSGERALAIIQMGFEHLGLNFIKIRTDKNNKKANKSIQNYIKKVGGKKRYEYEEFINHEIRKTNIYIITNIDYRNSGKLDVIKNKR